MPIDKKYKQRFTIIVVTLIAGGIIFYLFSPEESKFFPQCPFHYLTGLDCPGCGSQRAVHHLLHLDIKNAFLCNPLLVVAVPYLIFGVYMEYFGGKECLPKTRKALYGKRAACIILVVIILFWIGRNII